MLHLIISAHNYLCFGSLSSDYMYFVFMLHVFFSLEYIC